MSVKDSPCISLSLSEEVLFFLLVEKFMSLFAKEIKKKS